MAALHVETKQIGKHAAEAYVAVKDGALRPVKLRSVNDQRQLLSDCTSETTAP